MEQFYVGVARESITPALGTMLQGYTPPRPALSVNDDVNATAFAFQYGELRALLISVEMCNMSKTIQDGIKKAIQEATGLPAGNMIISCTHTHSSGHSWWDYDEPNGYVPSRVTPQAVKAAEAALASLRPAQMGVGTTQSDVAVNRREIREDGKIVLGQNVYGSYDPTMTVVSFREPDGTPIGNLIHYGCHNTAAGKTDEVTRDWSGVAIDRLEDQSGGITAFFNGCGGDCGPRLPNGKTTSNLKMALELGGKAGVDACRAWRNINVWEDVDLHLLNAEIDLPMQPARTAEDIEAEAAALGDPKVIKNLTLRSYERLMERAAYVRSGKPIPTKMTIEHNVLAIGPLVFFPIPFEPFSIITLRIKAHSPYRHTLCLGYSNGAFSYFPSMDQMIRGGYEVRMFRTMNLFPLADDAEQHYVAGATSLIRQLKEQK